MFGAIIGCAKDDIKRALAASTMSQIGYMGAGRGPRAGGLRVSAILHLLTHGFFKAACSSAPAAVIHAMDEEQDMRHYGGLRSAHTVTFGHLRPGLPGDHRRAAVRGLLLQRRHHRSRVWERRSRRLDPGRGCPAGRRNHPRST